MNFRNEQDPVKKSPWDGVLDATKGNTPQCLQLGRDEVSQKQDSETIIGVEDCLVLNVYAPIGEKDELLMSTNHKLIPGEFIVCVVSIFDCNIYSHYAY